MQRLLAALLILSPLALAPAQADYPKVVHLRTAPLTVTSHGKTYRFDVEVARTEAEQARGLMYRRSIPARGGMIFPMRPPRFASFWMKNTLVPLDIVFIRPNGTIVRVADARALDLSPIQSYEPVSGVLELRAGRAAELGIGPGDRVTSPALR